MYLIYWYVMRRNSLNYLVDVITLLVMFSMVATGLVIRFVLPPGTGGRLGGAGKVLWECDRHDWGDIHFWLAAILGCLLLLHVALHWNWVCVTTRRFIRPGKAIAEKNITGTNNLYGIAFLSVIFGVFSLLFWIASASVDTIRGANDYDLKMIDHEDIKYNSKYESHDVEGIEIRGSMMLVEIEHATGVPVAVILSELGLP